MARRVPSFRPGGAQSQREAKKATNAEYDKRRGSASSRGYDSTWQKLRARFLRNNPLCKMHKDKGEVVAGELVDHIQPLQSKDDPGRLDEANLMTLCVPCHARKTRQDIAKGLTRKY